MESALSPREIQTRIRSGASVDDVAGVAGIEPERVERFAAPVLAEREHVAGLAMASSARRRGETSSHRTLRGVVNERLLNQGVDIDTVEWDSYRLEDGRWAVTADYLAADTPRQALFYFDRPGRFSVGGNDEGRRILGDVASGRRPSSDEDTEPTVDLSDELALVRAIQDAPASPPASPEPSGEAGSGEHRIADVVPLDREPVEPGQVEPGQSEAEQGEAEQGEPFDEWAEDFAADSDLDAPSELIEDRDTEAGEPEAAEPEATEPEAAEPEATEPEAPETTGPSDASAVPELGPSAHPAWEPAIVVDYPVEPSEDDGDTDGVEVPEGSDDPGRPEPPVAGQDRRDEAAGLEEVPEVEEPAGESTEQVLPLDVPEQPARPAAKPVRRKRASVPSWDEIVFGGPKEK